MIRMTPTPVAVIYLALVSAVMALPNSGSTPPVTTPPPSVDPYVLVIVFTDGDPAAALDTDTDTKLPKRYTDLNACTTAGNQWLGAAANPAGQTVLKFNCVQVKKNTTTGKNYLLDGNGNKLVAAPNNYLLAR